MGAAGETLNPNVMEMLESTSLTAALATRATEREISLAAFQGAHPRACLGERSSFVQDNDIVTERTEQLAQNLRTNTPALCPFSPTTTELKLFLLECPGNLL